MALNTDYTSGPGVQIVAAVFNLISCQQLCMTFPNCLDFTVVVSNGDCYLKSGGDAVPSPRAGFKTGKRVCECEQLNIAKFRQTQMHLCTSTVYIKFHKKIS
jgi:hypothetical protein